MPSTVKDVSAMFVATMHFLTPSGACQYRKKINLCIFSYLTLGVNLMFTNIYLLEDLGLQV